MGKLVHVQRALEKKKTAKGTEFIDAVAVLNDLMTSMDKPQLAPDRFETVAGTLHAALNNLREDFLRLKMPDNSSEFAALQSEVKRLERAVTKLATAVNNVKIEMPEQGKREFVFNIERNRAGYLKRVVAKEV